MACLSIRTITTLTSTPFWCIHVQSLVIHKTKGLNKLPIRSKVGDVSNYLFRCSRTWSVMFVTKSCHLPFQATAVKFHEQFAYRVVGLGSKPGLPGCWEPGPCTTDGSVPLIPPVYLMYLHLCTSVPCATSLRLIRSWDVYRSTVVHRPPLCPPRIWLEPLEPGAVDSVDSFAVASVTRKLAGHSKERTCKETGYFCRMY